MKFQIKKATMADITEIYEMMKQGKADCQNPEWYSIDDEAYVQEHVMEKQGFVLKVVSAENTLAGFLLVHYPAGPGEQYVTPEPLDYKHVAYMDSVAVDPQFRGQKLQQCLIRQAEAMLCGTPYYHLMCTVHPDNCYSLENMKKLGYQVVEEARLYGGLPRLILYKKLGEDIRETMQNHSHEDGALRRPDRKI